MLLSKICSSAKKNVTQTINNGCETDLRGDVLVALSGFTKKRNCLDPS